jgi:hypothetical protein
MGSEESAQLERPIVICNIAAAIIEVPIIWPKASREIVRAPWKAKARLSGARRASTARARTD